MANKIQIRRDTASNWTSSNPTLSQGEQGYETDTGKLKIGDGSTAWTSLGYSFEGGDASNYTVTTKTSSFTVATSDLGKILYVDPASSAVTASLPAAATAGSGFYVTFTLDNNEGIYKTLTIDPNGSETICGLSTYKIKSGMTLTIYTNGSNWFSLEDSNHMISTNSYGSKVQADANGNRSIAIGDGAYSNNNYSTALGKNAYANGVNSIAIGATNSTVTADAASATAIGANSGSGASQAHGNGAIALNGSYASGNNSFAGAIADNSSSYGATGANSIALGDRSKSTGSRGIAIGGYGAVASGASSLAFGYQATANQSYASGFGYASKAYGAYSFAGNQSHASGSNSVALGLGDTSTSYGALHDNGVALGYQATTSAAKQIALGSSTAQVKVSGAYTLPTADGTNGQVLTTDGSGAVTFATASGGGADLYAANPSSATNPTATGSNSVAIGSDAQATATNGSIAFGTSTRASGNANAAIGFQANASGVGALAIGYVANAAADFSTAVGRNAKTVTGSSATAIGQAYASGSDSFAAAIARNTSPYGATGNYSIAIGQDCRATSISAVAIGDGNIAQGLWSCSIGGYGNTVSAGSSIGGYSNTVSASYGIAVGGYNNTASKNYTVATGRDAVANIRGKIAHASQRFSANGDAQTGTFILRSDTTDATAEALTSNNSTASTDNQVVLPNNSAYFFSGTCIARQQAADGTDVGAWEFKGAIRREANAGTTTLIKSTIDEFNVPTGWALALSADTTNGCLKIQVTGVAATDIRWVATVHTSEVTYA